MSLEYHVGDSIQFITPTDARLAGMFGRVVDTMGDDLVVEFCLQAPPAGYTPTIQIKADVVTSATITFIGLGSDHG